MRFRLLLFVGLVSTLSKAIANPLHMVILEAAPEAPEIPCDNSIENLFENALSCCGHGSAESRACHGCTLGCNITLRTCYKAGKVSRKEW